MISIQRILVPTDFSESSNLALRYGKEFAKTFGAELHLLHVIEDTLLYGGSMPVPPVVFEEMEKTVREQFKKLVTDEEREDLKARTLSRTGSPFVEICRYAKEENIDLIVIGTHGRGPIAHMLMGSVADRVVHKAPCPVLSVRPEEHEFVMP